MTTKRKWTAQDITRVWKWKDAGWSNTRIGERLKRSAASVSYIVRQTHDHREHYT